MNVTPPTQPGDGSAGPPQPPYPSAPSPSAPAYPNSGYYPPAPAAGPAGWSPAGPTPGMAYAGFGSRFLGYIVDAILLFVVEAIITVPFAFLPVIRFYQDHPVASGQPLPSLPADVAGRFALVGLVGALVSALYFGGLVAWQGRTLGQRMVGATVVRAEDGGRLPAGRSFLRAIIFWGPGVLGLLPYVGSLVSLLALVGLLAVAWDPRKQGWHDKLGRSLVVKRTAY